MVLVLIVMNMRLVVVNFMKYVLLFCIRCHDYSRKDLVLGAIIYAMVPCHLYVAYLIELAAAQQAKGMIGRLKRNQEQSQDVTSITKSFRSIWHVIAWAHGINATLALLVTTVTVYSFIHHPLVGTSLKSMQSWFGSRYVRTLLPIEISDMPYSSQKQRHHCPSFTLNILTLGTLQLLI